MTDLLDLGKRLDRASYDLAKSLVKLDEVQRHPEMDSRQTQGEVRARLIELRGYLEKVERLDVLNGKDNDSSG